MNPKLRLQNGIGTEDLSLKCRKNLKPRKNKLRKIMHYLYEVLAGTAKMNLKCW